MGSSQGSESYCRRGANDVARATGKTQPLILPPVLARLIFSVGNNRRERRLPLWKLACVYGNSYPSEPNRQGEHVSMANKLFGIFLCLILSACSTPPKAPTTDERTVHQGRGEVEKLHTENPPPGYTGGMDARLKAELPLAGTTKTQAAAPPPDPRCTKQLEHGYALRERIDNEYWQSRRAGTFLERRDEFTARWGEEAGEWAAETRAVLLQIGGPTAKGRFQNAQTPIGMVSGDVKWNNIRNFLRTRLAALESICKAP